MAQALLAANKDREYKVLKTFKVGTPLDALIKGLLEIKKSNAHVYDEIVLDIGEPVLSPSISICGVYGPTPFDNSQAFWAGMFISFLYYQEEDSAVMAAFAGPKGTGFTGQDEYQSYRNGLYVMDVYVDNL